MSQRSNARIKQIKREVAAEAARIMATEGQRNYLAAKQKAADRLGVTSALALPSNVAVEQALKAYLDLYGGEQRSDHIKLLRQEAVKAMRFFDQFSPRLVGPVLEGTADRHSRISLHTFSDTPDEVILFFMENGIEFRQEQRRIRWHDGSFRSIGLLVTEVNDITVELGLFEHLDQRQAPPCPVDGKPQKRAGLNQVLALLDTPVQSNHPLNGS